MACQHSSTSAGVRIWGVWHQSCAPAARRWLLPAAGCFLPAAYPLPAACLLLLPACLHACRGCATACKSLLSLAGWTWPPCSACLKRWAAGWVCRAGQPGGTQQGGGGQGGGAQMWAARAGTRCLLKGVAGMWAWGRGGQQGAAGQARRSHFNVSGRVPGHGTAEASASQTHSPHIPTPPGSLLPHFNNRFPTRSQSRMRERPPPKRHPGAVLWAAAPPAPAMTSLPLCVLGALRGHSRPAAGAARRARRARWGCEGGRSPPLKRACTRWFWQRLEVWSREVLF